MVAAAQSLSGAASSLDDQGIRLNSWAAQDLRARVGDTLELIYLIPLPDGTYRDGKLSMVLRGIVETAGPEDECGLTPDFEGISDADRIDRWKAPFPIEMNRVTKRDETYWKRYRTTPKAFVSLNTAHKMWAGAPAWVTSVRVRNEAGSNEKGIAHEALVGFGISGATWAPCAQRELEGLVPEDGLELSFPPHRSCARSSNPETPWQRVTRNEKGGSAPLNAAFERALLRRLSPEGAGMIFRPVRRIAIASAAGATDLGQLMTFMGFFLVIAGAGLAGMLMRLSAQQRAAQVGVMLACGFTPWWAAAAVFGEGIVLAAAGVIVGVPAGIVYAAGIVWALRSWWAGAAGASQLWIHITAGSLAAGALSGLLVGALSAAWAAAGLRKANVIETAGGLAVDGIDGIWPPPRFHPRQGRRCHVSCPCAGRRRARNYRGDFPGERVLYQRDAALAGGACIGESGPGARRRHADVPAHHSGPRAAERRREPGQEPDGDRPRGLRGIRHCGSGRQHSGFFADGLHQAGFRHGRICAQGGFLPADSLRPYKPSGTRQPGLPTGGRTALFRRANNAVFDELGR